MGEREIVCLRAGKGGLTIMKTLILALAMAAASGNDAYWTQHNLARGAHEIGPLARYGLGQHPSTGRLVVYFSADAALHTGGAWLLRRRGHRRAADLLMLEGIADHGEAGAYSAVKSR